MVAKVISAGRTDIGKRRENNQDQFLIAELHKSMFVFESSISAPEDSRLFGDVYGRLFVVADGMGGHQAGNRASALAIELLVSQLLGSLPWLASMESDREGKFVQELKRLFTLAHRGIERESIALEEHRGMGTTLTMAYVLWPHMFVVHAGDSRCYLIRNHEIRQLTTDHTVSNQLVRQGGLREEDASHSPWSNVLFNALGAGGREVEADVYKVTLEFGDSVLLCSDGLYRLVKDDEIRDWVARDVPPADCCQALLDLANQRGGIDNITAVVARFASPDGKRDLTDLHATTTGTKELNKSKVILQDTADF